MSKYDVPPDSFLDDWAELDPIDRAVIFEFAIVGAMRNHANVIPREILEGGGVRACQGSAAHVFTLPTIEPIDMWRDELGRMATYGAWAEAARTWAAEHGPQGQGAP